MASTITPAKLQELREKALALKAAREVLTREAQNGTQSESTLQSEGTNGNNYPATSDPSQEMVESNGSDYSHHLTESRDSTGKILQWNQRQQQFIDQTVQGHSGILIGAAGTGKTTSMRGAIESLILSGKAGTLADFGHKYLVGGTAGIVACAYTRRAVQNLRKAMPADLVRNCITIHKLLEYSPIWYEVEDADGNLKNTMRFEPTRNHLNPLSSSIRVVIIDESSMVSTELFGELVAALPHDVQFIFLGDIQQLPPVFGSAILGYKMLEYPEHTVELTEVYRQALESPIIRLAHRILSGNVIESSVNRETKKHEFSEWKFPGQLTLHPWQKRISADNALLTAAKFLTTAAESGAYNPERDIVLCPFNKAFGTIELNKHIANYLGRTRFSTVYEIVAGFQKHYLAVGDKVLFDKEDAVIESITYNGAYAGKMPLQPSQHMDRWGYVDAPAHTVHHIEQTEDQVDMMLEAISSNEGERKQEASHIVTLRMLADDSEATLNTAAEFNALDLGYALTVHKSQGSEWEKVFLLLHQSHNTMLQRELLYTAITRAKKELYVICEPDHFIKGIQNQRIVGNTLAEKAEFFKGKVDRNERQSLTK